MVGSSTANRFYFDLSSPLAYLAAERVNHVLGEVPEWVPVRFDLSFRCAEEVLAYREDVERAARAQGVQALVWPDPFPSDSEWAMLVATYAKQIGRAVAFSLAAFRHAIRDQGCRSRRAPCARSHSTSMRGRGASSAAGSTALR